MTIDKKNIATATRYEIRIREFKIDDFEHEVRAGEAIMTRLEVCAGCAHDVADSVAERLHA